ncbi:putative repeat protein (TIGR03833 family) [Kroppenstedtia sanguinis]
MSQVVCRWASRSAASSHLENVREVNRIDGRKRSEIRPGQRVDIVLKADQRTGRRTRGVVREILTKSPTHPHGIKVRLEDGQVGRVQEILD